MCVVGNGYNFPKIKNSQSGFFPANIDRKLQFQSQVSWISWVVGQGKNKQKYLRRSRVQFSVGIFLSS